MTLNINGLNIQIQRQLYFNVYIPDNSVSNQVKQKLIKLKGVKNENESTSTVHIIMPLNQKWTDSENRKSVRTELDSVMPSVN